MALRNSAIEKIKKERAFLFTEFGVKKIGIFGSVAVGTDNEKSDIDLLVEFNRPVGFKFVSLVEYLEHVLGRKVDLVTHDGLENIRVKKVAQSIRETLIYV